MCLIYIYDVFEYRPSRINCDDWLKLLKLIKKKKSLSHRGAVIIFKIFYFQVFLTTWTWTSVSNINRTLNDKVQTTSNFKLLCVSDDN